MCVVVQVLELSLLLSDGQLMTLSANDDDDKVAEMFHAARLSLGALGVIVSIKLQCEPAFKLQQVQYGVPLKDVRMPRTQVLEYRISSYRTRDGALNADTTQQLDSS